MAKLDEGRPKGNGFNADEAIKQILKKRTDSTAKLGKSWDEIKAEEQRFEDRIKKIEPLVELINKKIKKAKSPEKLALHYITSENADERLAQAGRSLQLMSSKPVLAPSFVDIFVNEKDGDVRRILFDSIMEPVLENWKYFDERIQRRVSKFAYDALDDRNDAVKKLAMEKLVLINERDEYLQSEISKRITEMLRSDENPAVRQTAAAALGFVEDLALQPLMAAFYEETDETVKAKIVDSMCNICATAPNKKSIVLIIDFLNKEREKELPDGNRQFIETATQNIKQLRYRMF